MGDSIELRCIGGAEDGDVLLVERAERPGIEGEFLRFYAMQGEEASETWLGVVGASRLCAFLTEWLHSQCSDPFDFDRIRRDAEQRVIARAVSHGMPRDKAERLVRAMRDVEAKGHADAAASHHCQRSNANQHDAEHAAQSGTSTCHSKEGA